MNLHRGGGGLRDGRVIFYFDFGSPNAYLAHRVIPQIQEHSGLRFTYLPTLLGGVFKLTNNQSPVTAFAHVKNTSWPTRRWRPDASSSAGASRASGRTPTFPSTPC